ncbi:hypothetical protein NDU88_011326 [Pleurodeles waltl]|uniref:Uncharacterized protein n=1 Tax=Pleurodeles waltl TaxID=8319 RepID=A0AAV7S5T6_PLEWA|nr:hypothetical protein NDU88_011326 [Pleurodeles waltl]
MAPPLRVVVALALILHLSVPLPVLHFDVNRQNILFVKTRINKCIFYSAKKAEPCFAGPAVGALGGADNSGTSGPYQLGRSVSLLSVLPVATVVHVMWFRLPSRLQEMLVSRGDEPGQGLLTTRIYLPKISLSAWKMGLKYKVHVVYAAKIR